MRRLFLGDMPQGFGSLMNHQIKNKGSPTFGIGKAFQIMGIVVFSNRVFTLINPLSFL